MKSVLLAILIAAPIFSQTLHGLGYSSKTCIDLDGDGYGTGPLANLVTTAAGSVTAGVHTVTIGATTGLVTGQRVRYDSGPNLEFVILTAVSGSTITGAFGSPHASGVTVSAGTIGDGSLWFPGYPTDDPGCLGLDADDRDGTVQTAAQGIARYGSLSALLAKVGGDWQTLESDSAADVNGNAGQAAAAAALLIKPNHTYYVAPASASSGCTGTPAQCAGQSYPANNCTSINSPCLTISDLVLAGYSNSGLGGDLIIARDGWNNNFLVVTMWSGSSSRYNGLWSYPGEHAVLSNGLILGAPTSCPVPNSQTNYFWVDGMRLKSTAAHFGGAIIGGSCPNTSGQNHDIVITHNHGTESDNGNLAPLTGFNHIDNWTIAYNALHDDNCPSNCNTPHGFYMGGGQGPSSNTTIRRNLIFRNSWNGLHWNGQATGFFIDQNVVYDNGVTGLDFEEGLSHSYIRANQSFNNAKQLLFFLYPGNCPTQSGYDPASPLVLCPTGENYNVIENNTFYDTGNANMANAGTSPDGGCPTGVLYCAQPPIQLSNVTSPLAGDLGNNTFRNNIIVSYGVNDRKPPIAYGDPTASGTCGSACQGWAGTSTFDHNLFWQSDGKGGLSVLLLGPNKYTCGNAVSVTAAFTNCNVGDPQFAAEAISNWNVESYFDFRLLPASPALHAGSATGIPNYDTMGNAYASTPSFGALESSSPAPPAGLPSGTPLSISITSPSGGATVSGSVAVSATASAPAGIASIKFTLDGANLGVAGTSTPYSVTWGTSGAANGSHVLAAIIVDLAGNSVTSAAVSVLVNNVAVSPPTISPPTISITSPVSGASLQGTVSISATASPGSVEIGSVQFKVDGINSGSPLRSPPYSALWDTTTAINGTHSLTATATDNLGNAASSSPLTVTVNNASGTSGPAISGVAAGSITASEATISWTTNTASDSQLSYGTTTAYGLTSSLATSPVTAHVVTIPGLSPSTAYHYQVLSRDGQGNLASSADFSFTTAPSSPSLGWQDLTNTQLQSVCPADNFNGINYAFADNCHSVITAWGSAVADTKRNRLIIWGGGHVDYSGNEVYSLNLGAAPPTFTRLTDPSDFTQNPPGCPDTNTVDGTPVSRHTYGGIVYLPVQDKMFSFAGALAPCGGPMSNRTYTLDLSKAVPTWQAMDPINGYNATGYQSTSATCGYDPNTQTVICNTTGVFFRYDPATNTNTLLSTGQPIPFEASGVIDPKRKLFVFMGTQYQSTAPHVFALDLSSGSSFQLQDWSSQVTGCDPVAGSGYPGLVYDPVLDRIVGWPNSGNSVYIFNADQKTCTAQTFSNGPTSTVASTPNGTFGRFQYFPALNAYVVVSLASLDAYKLTLSPTAPPLAGNACDLNSDGVINSLDVAIAVNQTLGSTSCGNASLQGNGQCTVVDVQRVVNAALGGACITGP